MTPAQRTNPTDIPASSFVPSEPGPSRSTPTLGPASAVAGLAGQTKKKQAANVRKILYARKSLKDWLDELPQSPTPPYLLAVTPPPAAPPRRLCSSCGYIGAYKCVRCGEWSCDRDCVEVHERDAGCGVGG
ncbi:hypothetical protein JCM24511_09923 [Saitozyma sp. JCM 24511]|nr:hypothetical protein JCM24511_09923 [Saitozyma sp. JCM 24511]